MSESVKMLQILKGEGVDNILATPHFYPDSDDLDTFLARRNTTLDALIKAKSGKDLPNVFPGCELYYTRGMADFESLAKLRIANTQYILIELPYGGFKADVLEDILNFSINYNLIPIFAHLERFGIFKGFKEAMRFVAEGNALAQVNVSSFFDKRLKKHAITLAKNNLISFVGSDFHRAEKPTEFRKGINHIKMLYPNAIKKIEFEGNNLLNAIMSQRTTD